MPWTHDYLVRLILDDAGANVVPFEAKQVDLSTTRFLRQLVSLSPSTTNYQVQFGSNFATPTKLMLTETNSQTFTVSVNSTAKHVYVEAGGCFFLHGSITSLYLSNNSTLYSPTVEILLVR